MQFSHRIMLAMNKAPEGWSQKLTLGQYAKLDDDRKRYYAPLFAKYRSKKVRDYDPDCGHFVGWKPIKVGIGEPIGYEYVGYIAAKAIDAVFNSNILMKRILKR